MQQDLQVPWQGQGQFLTVPGLVCCTVLCSLCPSGQLCHYIPALNPLLFPGSCLCPCVLPAPWDPASGTVHSSSCGVRPGLLPFPSPSGGQPGHYLALPCVPRALEVPTCFLSSCSAGEPKHPVLLQLVCPAQPAPVSSSWGLCCSFSVQHSGSLLLVQGGDEGKCPEYPGL